MDCGKWQVAIKLIQVMSPVSAAVQDVVPLLEQIDTSTGSWYTAIDLTNVFFWYPH